MMKTKWKETVFFLSFVIFALPVSTFAQSELLVATRESPPFSFKDQEGRWRGISIDLWKHIAETNGYTFKVRETTLEQLLQGVQKGTYNVGVAGVSITSKRARVIDFSQPFISSSLGIAYIDTRSPWLDVLGKFISLAFLKVVLLLVAILLLAGVGVWYFERKKNEEFSGKGTQGLGAAFWWSAVTMTTVGYGDKSPQTSGGRTIALIWMFTSVIILTSFTAAIVTSLSQASYLPDKTIADLRHDKVGAIEDSVSDALLRDYQIKPIVFQNPKQMIEALQAGDIDDVLHDLPVLRFFGTENAKDYRLMPLKEYRQDYGLALPRNAPIENDVNVELLRFIKKPAWREIRKKYLGDWSNEAQSMN